MQWRDPVILFVSGFVPDRNYYVVLTFRPGVGHLLEQRRVGDVGQPLDRLEQVRRKTIADAGVEQVPVFVQDEVVRIAVQLLEAEGGGVAMMNLVDGISERAPDLIGTSCVHLDERAEGLFGVRVVEFRAGNE